MEKIRSSPFRNSRGRAFEKSFATENTCTMIQKVTKLPVLSRAYAILLQVFLSTHSISARATRSTETSRSASNRGGRALEILKERYAKGEITKEQFLTMKRELEA